ncbi:hypothetical protein K7J39_003173 [Salmonella enterica]|nr:hypothetical protein [Salmonella enterica]EIA4662427.1 hypothetical protein [Salmonella enterica]
MNSNLFRLVGPVVPMMMSMLFISAAAAESSETEFIVRTKANESCSVTSDKNVSLGFVSPNTTKKSSPFVVKVTCPGPAPSYVWARHVNGQSNHHTQVNMEIDGVTHLDDKGTLVQLFESGYAIDLTGMGETNPGNGFCGGNETRTCNVEPTIITGSAAVLGKGTVTVRFNLRHT